MKMLKVRVKEPVLYCDEGWGETFVLDVSHDQFKADPNNVYKVPDKPFWRDRWSGEKAILILVGEDEPRRRSKKEEVKEDEEV